MSEDVIGWYPYHPIKNITSEDMHVTQNNDCMFKNGVLYTFSEQLHDFGVWACVAPMSGREYAEAQKIRAETTYNITTRYTENVSSIMKILYGAKVFDIVSVLDVGAGRKNSKLLLQRRISMAKNKDVFGFEELEKSFKRLEKRYPSQADAMLMAQGQAAQKRVKALTPVKTKKLRNAWRLKK